MPGENRSTVTSTDAMTSFRLLWIVIPLFLLVVAIALLLPAVQQAREAARRSQSKNNLKQIGLALHNYHDAHRMFPPGGTFNERGEAHHGWVTQLLPYLDASPVYSWINFRLPWDAPENAGLFRRHHGMLENPSLARQTEGRHFARADYSANSHLLAPNSSIALSDVQNRNATMIVGELGGDFVPWGCPFNWRPLIGLNATPRTYGRPEGFGGNFLMVDGSVQWISPDVSVDVLEALRGPDLAGNAYAGPPIVRPASFPYPEEALERSFVELPGRGQFQALLIKNTGGDVVKVNLHRGKGDTRRATDDDLAAISTFQELRELDAGGDFTDAGMTALHHLNRLEVLQLSSCDVSDGALEFLKQLPDLRRLTLDRRELTRAFLKTLNEIPHLEELTLRVCDHNQDLAEFEADLQQRIGLRIRIERKQ